MQEYHFKTIVGENGTITVKDVPLPQGETVNVTVVTMISKPELRDENPLLGSVIFYDGPFDGVATNDWDATK